MRRLLPFLRSLPPRPTLAVASFASVVIGLALERLSLALILPGAFIFSCLTITHLRGVPTKPDEEAKS